MTLLEVSHQPRRRRRRPPSFRSNDTARICWLMEAAGAAGAFGSRLRARSSAILCRIYSYIIAEILAAGITLLISWKPLPQKRYFRRREKLQSHL